jgi:hypothetical protein
MAIKACQLYAGIPGAKEDFAQSLTDYCIKNNTQAIIILIWVLSDL